MNGIFIFSVSANTGIFIPGTMKIQRIDHIVIPVKDIRTSIRFYTEILGMELDNNPDHVAVKFGEQKINLHRGKNEYLPAAKTPTYGSTDICFLAKGDILSIKEELENKGVIVEEGIVRRKGASGDLYSLYLRDPDGNLIEISTPV